MISRIITMIACTLVILWGLNEEDKREAALLDKERPTPYKAGYGRRWQRLRLMVLARDPICKICNREPSVDVDHIIPKEDGGPDSMENLQGACHSCHSKKTMKERNDHGARS